MAKFAAQTSVPVEKSVAEIQRTLERYGASQFIHGTDRDRGLASIQFFAQGRQVRFILKLPARDDPRFHWTPGGRKLRSPDQRYAAWEQACRQHWRALALCIKAKLEAVEAGISVFEDEFLAHILLPGGKTVSDLVRPQLEQAYVTGCDIPGIAGLLPAPEPSDESKEEP